MRGVSVVRRVHDCRLSRYMYAMYCMLLGGLVLRVGEARGCGLCEREGSLGGGEAGIYCSKGGRGGPHTVYRA